MQLRMEMRRRLGGKEHVGMRPRQCCGQYRLGALVGHDHVHGLAQPDADAVTLPPCPGLVQ
jgi:hypothetical protein